VFGGMLAAAVFVSLFVPIFFKVNQTLREKFQGPEQDSNKELTDKI
jgi:hypothetical protein